MDTNELPPLMLSYVIHQLQCIFASYGDIPVYAGHLGESEVSVKGVMAGHNSNFQETVFLEVKGIPGMAHPAMARPSIDENAPESQVKPRGEG